MSINESTEIATAIRSTATAAKPTASGTRPTGPRKRVSLLILVAGLVLGALASLVLGPFAPRLGEASGDAALAQQVRDLVGDDAGFGVMSVGTVQAGETTWAGFGEGVTAQTVFELGSITKTFTGMLFADAIDRGEVALDDPLSAHLSELAGTAVGDVTLRELATHTGGLAPLPDTGFGTAMQAETEALAGRMLTAYRSETTESLIAAAATVTPDPATRGSMAYSNLGMSLLGHALARAAGAADWGAVVQDRLWTPLGMHDTFLDDGTGARPPTPPRLSGGPSVDAWTGLAFAPAGTATRTTAADLARFAAAILDGTAPGVAALDPIGGPNVIAPGAPEMRFGLAWLQTDTPDAPVNWHNGGTAGSRTMIEIDRDHQRAAVVLNASTRDVTGLGMLLVGQEGWPPSLPEVDSLIKGGLGLLFVAQLLLGAIFTRSRLTLLAALGLAVAGVTLLGLAAPWAVLPGWLFGASAGLTAGGIVVAARRWPSLTWLPAGRIRPVLAFVPVLVAAPLLAWMLVVLGMRLVA